MKYRSDILITLAILEAIHHNGEANIRQLITRANIPYTRLKIKIDQMIELGIVDTKSITKCRKNFLLTDKGKETLVKLRELISFLTLTGLVPEELVFNGR